MHLEREQLSRRMLGILFNISSKQEVMSLRSRKSACSTVVFWKVAPLLPLGAIRLFQRGLVVDGGRPALEPGRFACWTGWCPGLPRPQRSWCRPVVLVPPLDAGRELVLCLQNMTVGCQSHPYSQMLAIFLER